MLQRHLRHAESDHADQLRTTRLAYSAAAEVVIGPEPQLPVEEGFRLRSGQTAPVLELPHVRVGEDRRQPIKVVGREPSQRQAPSVHINERTAT